VAISDALPLEAARPSSRYIGFNHEFHYYWTSITNFTTIMQCTAELWIAIHRFGSAHFRAPFSAFSQSRIDRNVPNLQMI